MTVATPIRGVKAMPRGRGRGPGGGGVVERNLSAAIRRKLQRLAAQHGHDAVISAARRVLA